MGKTKPEPIGWVGKTLAATMTILLLAIFWTGMDLLSLSTDVLIIIMVVCVIIGFASAYASSLARVSKPIEWGLAGFAGMTLMLLVFPITSRSVGITFSLLPPSFGLAVEPLVIGAIGTAIAVASLLAGWAVFEKAGYGCAGKWLLAGGVFHLAWGVSMFLSEAHRAGSLGLLLLGLVVSLACLTLLAWKIFQKRR